MPPRKPKQTIALLKNQDENKTLEKLEAGINVKIGNKNINQLYNEKLNQNIDLTETVSKTISKPQPKPKIEKPVKQLTEKGKKATERLSKYRAQVKEALELKKNIDNKNLFSYSDDEEDDEEPDSDIKAIETIKTDAPIIPSLPVQAPLPVQQPIVDLTPIYNELETIKKKNKELEDKFVYRNSIVDISNMRRNMSIKF